LDRLAERGVKCTYVELTGVSYIMKEVTKVYLGAHAMLSNGAILGRTGCAVVAMMAHAYHVPVLVPCETYKFHERVQLDSICYNELEDPYLLDNGKFPHDVELGNIGKISVPTKKSGKSQNHEWSEIAKLKLLNLVYDVTPMSFVNMVITEVGLIPPTSVPAVIRESEKKALEDRINWRSEVEYED